MIKILLTIGASYGLVLAAFVILMTKVFFPYHRIIAVCIYAISWIPFLRYNIAHRRLLVEHSKTIKNILIHYWPQVCFGLLLIIFLYSIVVLVPVTSTQLLSLNSADLQTQAKQDMQSIQYINATITERLQQIEKQQLYTQVISNRSIQEQVVLQDQWQRFIELMFELEIFKEEYKGFHQLDVSSRGDDHAAAFLVAYSAHVAQYRHMLTFTRLFDANTSIVNMLNEAVPTKAIPANMYTQLKLHLTNPKDILRLNAGRAYLYLIEDKIPAESTGIFTLKSQLADIDGSLLQFPRLIVQHPFEFFEKNASITWMPIQKNIALQLSYIRGVRRDYFIQPSMIKKYQPLLEPMDILLERRNWHATNVGIPGFWPHIAVYLGTLQELDSYFTDLEMLQGASVSTYLQNTHPNIYEQMLTLDEQGYAYRVIESKRPGVLLFSLEESANADSVAAIRPKLTKQQKFAAMLETLSHYGKPYDYNFDFATSEALVCSELAYRALHMRGPIVFEPKFNNGRLLVSPNEFAQKFDAEYNTPMQQFDFVFFLATSEKNKTVTERTLEEFKTSWQWSKWEVLQD